MKREPCAVGLSIHTGWASCVIAAGSAKSPHILAREIVEVLGENAVALGALAAWSLLKAD